MKSKLTLHVQRLDTATGAWLLRARPSFVKLVDPTPGDCAWVKANLPGCRIIGRVTDLPADPALAAKRIVGADSATLGAVDYHELWNEPGGSADDLRTLNANTLVVLGALPSRFKVLVGSLAQGNPPNIADFALLAPAIREAKRRGGGVATHEYDAPTMATSGEYRIGRFRLLRATLPADLRDVGWYITEFGLDGGCLTPPLQDTGWEHFTDEPGLLAQIKMAEMRYYVDPQVKAVCAFTAGAYAPWNKPGQSFEMAGTAKIAAYVGDSGASTPLPTGGKSVDYPTVTKLTVNHDGTRERTIGAVIHSTRSGRTKAPDGTPWTLQQEYDATVNYELTPGNNSSHAIVGPAEIALTVPIGLIAWHATYLNHSHLGAEVVEPTVNDDYTDFQYQATAFLCRQWAVRYSFPLIRVMNENQPGLIGHQDSAQGRGYQKSDPGPKWNWAKFIALCNPNPVDPVKMEVDLWRPLYFDWHDKAVAEGRTELAAAIRAAVVADKTAAGVT